MTNSPRNLSGKFVSFAGIGLISTGLQFAILGLLTDAFGMNAVIASCAAYAGSAYANYLLNRRLTFRSRASQASTLPKFAAVSFCGLMLNGALMAILVLGLHANQWIAQVITSCAVLILNFLGNLVWSFREART